MMLKLFETTEFLLVGLYECQRDGTVVREPTLPSVDLEFISHVESYQKTLKNSIHSLKSFTKSEIT